MPLACSPGVVADMIVLPSQPGCGALPVHDAVIGICKLAEAGTSIVRVIDIEYQHMCGAHQQAMWQLGAPGCGQTPAVQSCSAHCHTIIINYVSLAHSLGASWQ